MSQTLKSFDPIWEELYGQGSIARCPYDFVASFAFRNAPKDKPRKDIRILEIGCGSGNNLWFLAQEGFSVSGVDGSAAAIDSAKKRFIHDGLTGDLTAGDFTKLAYPDSSFDLVIDRGALTCCGTSSIKKAIAEVSRVLKPGGHFLFNPIADSDTSYRNSEIGEDGLSSNIKGGDFAQVGQIRFVSRREIDEFLPKTDWSFNRIERVEIQDMLNLHGKTTANWRVEVQKP